MITLFATKRALAELRLQRKALERIATCMEELLLQGRDRTTGTGIRSLYQGTEDGEVLVQNDQEFAELEMLEKERERLGGNYEEGE
jgi:hypothetical protein